MRRRGLLAAAALCAGCGVKIGGTGDQPVDAAGDDAPVTDDAPPDAPLGPFGTPKKISTAATGAAEDDPTLSSNGLELVFAIVDTADGNRKHLFYAQRATVNDDFGPATRLPFDQNGTTEQTPRFSADDKVLYFASDRTPTLGGLDIWQVPHPSAGNNWGTPTTVAGVSSAGVDKWFMPCGTQGRYLISRDADLAEGTLGGGAPVTSAELSSAQSEISTFVTQDCLNVYFASDRSGKTLLYKASRATATAPWGAPVVDDTFAMLGGQQQDPWLSPNGRIYVFVSDAAGNNDCYISTR